MYAKASSSLDALAPNVLVADYWLLLAGTKDRSARSAEGTCNRLDKDLCVRRSTHAVRAYTPGRLTHKG
jgi:hypothetical protein